MITNMIGELAMKWIINMRVKDYIRNWSNQEIITEYAGVMVNIKIKDTNCLLILNGNHNHDKVLRLIWELLSLFDGYFYEPVSYEVDGNVNNYKQLIKLGYFETDRKWYCSELLGRDERVLSTEVIKKYDEFRNKGIADKKMTKSVVNAFYYLKSKDYGKININHRLSLLLNIADGFIINTFKDMNNVKASLDRLFKKTVDMQKLQKGISLLGLDAENFKYILTEERNVFDHYIYSENSLATFVYNDEGKITNFATWYFVYVLELLIRINFLKESGVILDKDAIDYALDSINDWIIYENNLDEKCITSHYRMAQLNRKLGVDIR